MGLSTSLMCGKDCDEARQIISGVRATAQMLASPHCRREPCHGTDLAEATEHQARRLRKYLVRIGTWQTLIQDEHVCFWGVKRTSRIGWPMSANDPERTFRGLVVSFGILFSDKL